MCPPTIGTDTPRFAERPARPKARVSDSAVVLILALASSIGTAGSNATSPQLKLLTTVTMLSPFGSGQYAPGSSSCAKAPAGTHRQTIVASVIAAAGFHCVSRSDMYWIGVAGRERTPPRWQPGVWQDRSHLSPSRNG